jgi:hypothetical protein
MERASPHSKECPGYRGQERTDSLWRLGRRHSTPALGSWWCLGSSLGTSEVPQGVNEDGSKYFPRTKNINLRTKLEKFQPSFSIMWVFGFFRKYFSSKIAVFLLRRKQQLKGR